MLFAQMVKYYLLSLRGAVRLGFGLRKTLFLAIGLPFYLFFVHFTLLLDHLFFSRFCKVEIKQPIFIVGHPRSGTTFFHRLLTQQQDFVVFSLWEGLFPALTARKLLAPLYRHALKWQQKLKWDVKDGHELRLDMVETEEVLFCLVLSSVYMLNIMPIEYTKRGMQSIDFMPDLQPSAVAQARFLRRCFQRQILAKGKQRIMAKMACASTRVESLLKVFPDAQFIFLYRPPTETYPSLHSLRKTGMERHFGKGLLEEPRFVNNFKKEVAFSKHIYAHFEAMADKGKVNEKNTLLIDYNNGIKQNLGQTLSALFSFTGIQPSAALRQELDQVIASQMDYKRLHKNLDEADLPLSLKEIEAEIGFMDFYDFAPQLPHQPVKADLADTAQSQKDIRSL